jgi:hypothetical protein
MEVIVEPQVKHSQEYEFSFHVVHNMCDHD